MKAPTSTFTFNTLLKDSMLNKLTVSSREIGMLTQISKGMGGFENLDSIQGFFTDLPEAKYQVTAK